MKLRRFTDAGIDAVRALLPQIKTVDDLARAEALAKNDDLAKSVDELASIDLDETRVFSTTFAFCEYFHSLIKDHNPLAYRTDVGFWTWLAMVYVRQVFNEASRSSSPFGDIARVIYDPINYARHYRHLFAGPYYLYYYYRDIPHVCRAMTWHALNIHPDVTEQIASRYAFVHNPAFMAVVDKLYFDDVNQCVKSGAGGDGAAAARSLVRVIDQLAMTRDFFSADDSAELVGLLPRQFERFK